MCHGGRSHVTTHTAGFQESYVGGEEVFADATPRPGRPKNGHFSSSNAAGARLNLGGMAHSLLNRMRPLASLLVLVGAMSLAAALAAQVDEQPNDDTVVDDAAALGRHEDAGFAEYAAIASLASSDPTARAGAAERLLATHDRRWLPPLVDQLFFVPVRHRGEILRVLAGLAGERRERYLDWVEYLGEHPEIAPPRGYVGWKGALFSRIHPRFADLLRDGAPLRIRADEIVCGGVPFDGIPSLERPPHVAASETQLADSEPVFAAEIAGEARAWPIGVLSWHEMLNDELGGEPVTLSYCTLCRSAVLYRGRLPNGEETTFGTSGLLYRSNKLMFDRRTQTLWSNLTGEPLLGPLAAGKQPRALEMVPLVSTTWGVWRALHPRSTVMIGDPRVAQRYGYDYRAGAAERRRAGVSFPVPHADTRLPPNDEVWALRLDGHAKAYALHPLLAAGIVNDAVGSEPVVLIANADSGAIRAYRRGDRQFHRGDLGELLDDHGALWRVDEDALHLDGPAGAATDGGPRALQRLAGFSTFWFGWQAFYTGSELWTGSVAANR